MSTVTIAGLPVLAIIEDSHAGATSSGDEPQSPRPLPTGGPPRENGRAESSISGRTEQPRTA